jgi:hypothetical protein
MYLYAIKKQQAMTTAQIRTAAEEIINRMGGDGEEINNGDCATFAKRLVDACGGVIVDNLADSMKDELGSYETTTPDCNVGDPNDWRSGASHCWVKVAGMFFDAQNPEGVEEETDLEFFA